MKSAEEWNKELTGETSVESIREIQADTLRHAGQLVGQIPSLKTLSGDSLEIVKTAMREMFFVIKSEFEKIA